MSLQCLEIFVHLKQTLFLETARSNSEAKSGKQDGYSISIIDFWSRNCLAEPCELEHCHCGESNRWAKVQAFYYAQLHLTASVFPHNKID
jgi:hypothetical protein